MRQWFNYDTLFSLLKLASFLGKNVITDNPDTAEQMKILEEAGVTAVKGVDINSVRYEERHEYLDVLYCVDAVRLSRNNVRIEDFLLFGRMREKTVAIYNMWESGYSFPKEYYEYLSLICVDKEIYETNSFPVGGKSCIWIYDVKADTHRQIRKYGFYLDMKRRGFFLKVSTLSDIELYQEIEHMRVDRLYSELNTNYTMISSIENRISRDLLLIKEHQNMEAGSLLSQTDDLVSFLDICSLYRDKWLIILAIRDTPGDCLEEFELSALKMLGFERISKDLWRMHIGVLCNGKLIHNESAGHAEENLSFEGSLIDNNIDLHIESQAWRSGDVCRIEINGVDYAVNCRGVNIVVWDVENDRVIDSVCYDHHYTLPKFIRRRT